MIEVSYVRAFEDNYIWLVARPGSHGVIIVDPGDASPVLERIATDGLKPCAIFVTHHHGDHTGGVTELADHFGLPVYGPAHERIPGLTHPVREGDRILLQEPGLEFEVLDTPGHTRGHVCYVGHGTLFCGDTLFTAGCGRLFEGTAEQMHRSLEKIAALPDETLVYCAHEYTLANLGFARVAEPHNRDVAARQVEAERLRATGLPTVPSTLALEKRTNPFLRTMVPELIGAAEAFTGGPLRTGAEVFGAVRHWKDTLD